MQTFKRIFISCMLVSLMSCSTKAPYNSKLTIQSDLEQLADLHLDTSKFVVLTDSIHNTEGAFDLDYQWYVSIRLNAEYSEQLGSSIRESENFNSVNSEFDDMWNKIDTSKLKGIWCRDASTFKFIQKPKNFNPESFYLSIDSNKKQLDLQLIHL